jgi:hypothetical protein
MNHLAAAAPRVLGRLIRHAQRNAVAYTALFVALAGSSYAAVTINGSQIRNHTINPSKFNPRFTNGTPRAWAIVRPNGKVIASAGRPKVRPAASISLPGDYFITWGVKVGRCPTEVTIDGDSSPQTETVAVPGNPAMTYTAGYAVASSFVTPGSGASTIVQTFNQAGQPTPLAFDIAVIC